MTDLDRLAAARRERETLLAYCAGLTEPEWNTPSAAPGWTVKDVVAHLGANSHALFSPSGAALVRSGDLERANEIAVAESRTHSGDHVLAAYARWTKWQLRVASALVRTPAARIPARMPQFGPLAIGQLLTSSMVFDHHIHLRHDIAPVLERPVPASDEVRLRTVADWMFTLLAGQLGQEPEKLPERPVAFLLTGPGGGRWVLTPSGTVHAESPSAAEISGAVTDFPLWGTCRTPWRGAGLTIDGDRVLAEKLLDNVNII